LATIPIPKNGYIYVYCSNESKYNVFFDNLQVIHDRGPILEETHYYPFGLTMNGISSKALAYGEPKNKEKTFQGQRFDDELGLNWVQFKWRNHDPQIGRFVEIDPLSEKYVYNSTYAFSENKVIAHVELEGLESMWAFLKTLTNSAGLRENTNSREFLTQTASTLKEPETYKNAIGVLGPVVGAGLLIGMTGGIGTGTFIGIEARSASTTLRISPVTELNILPVAEARTTATTVEAGATTSNVGNEIGILRDAAKGKGNFGLGEASAATSNKLGQAWVGEGATVASDGKTLVSESGLRMYRPPSVKSSPHAETGVQSNFEWRNKPQGQAQGNGHLNITTNTTPTNTTKPPWQFW
jgi:RHS repeat-associated protein